MPPSLNELRKYCAAFGDVSNVNVAAPRPLAGERLLNSPCRGGGDRSDVWVEIPGPFVPVDFETGASIACGAARSRVKFYHLGVVALAFLPSLERVQVAEPIQRGRISFFRSYLFNVDCENITGFCTLNVHRAANRVRFETRWPGLQLRSILYAE